MFKKENLKKFLLIAIAFICLSGSAVAYAWWDRLTMNKYQENIITLGEGLEIVVDEVEIDPLTDGTLIPLSAVKKAGDTYEIVLTYTVRFEATLEEELDLSVEVENIMVGTEENPYDLIKIEVENDGVIQNDDVTITLTVTIDETNISTMTEAELEDAYTKLANQSISFDITFAATRQID